MVNQELNQREMYVAFVGLTETNYEQSLARGKRILLPSPTYIAYTLAVPYFPVSPYTLQCADDQYCLSLSTIAGDITYTHIERLYNRFLCHVIATDHVFISLTPAQLVERYGFFKLRKPSPSTLLIMKNVEVELFSRRSLSITDAQNDVQMNTNAHHDVHHIGDYHAELCISAMSVVEVQRGLDAQLSRRAYERNHMTARGYWYVPA
jgi:hypothetical protein